MTNEIDKKIIALLTLKLKKKQLAINIYNMLSTKNEKEKMLNYLETTADDKYKDIIYNALSIISDRIGVTM